MKINYKLHRPHRPTPGVSAPTGAHTGTQKGIVVTGDAQERDPASPHRGLLNMGNTSFMTAVFQCLYACAPLRHRLNVVATERIMARTDPATVLEHLATLFRNMQLSRLGSVSPADAHSSLPPPYNGQMQHNAIHDTALNGHVPAENKKQAFSVGCVKGRRPGRRPRSFSTWLLERRLLPSTISRASWSTTLHQST